jgi:hypothetical protein
MRNPYPAVSKEKLQSVLDQLKPRNIREQANARLQKKKEEILANSYSFEEIASKYGISTRRLKEYTSGKKVPRLGVTATKVGFIHENYVYDDKVKRWFPKDK